jgi:glycosyltransferase involved in cell wall biosynthesis
VQLGVTIKGKDYWVLPFSRFSHQRDGITVYQSFQRGLPKLVHYNVTRWVSIVESMFRDYIQTYGKPDILHAHCTKWAGYAAMRISQQYGIPYVVTEHLSLMSLEEEFGKAPSDAWQIPLLKQTYEQAAMVIPVAEELVADTACYYGTDYSWKHLSNVIDTDFFHYAERESRDDRPFRFCCVADYAYRKGYDVLLDACRLLQDQDCDIELHIAGRLTDGKACQQAITDRGLMHVVAHGPLDREGVRTLLYQSDALVLASRSEVQPLVVFEAMSTGIPVVGTTSIPRCQRLGKDCRIVPVGDAAALAEAMLTLSKEPAAGGQQLSEQVRQIASPEVVGKQLEQVFSDVLASN